jgi:hypothetical protein
MFIYDLSKLNQCHFNRYFSLQQEQQSYAKKLSIQELADANFVPTVFIALASMVEPSMLLLLVSLQTNSLVVSLAHCQFQNFDQSFAIFTYS